MPEGGIPEQVQRFIFESVDTVEFLEVLLHIHLHRSRSWLAAQIGSELRLNPDSVAHRLEKIRELGLCQVAEGPPKTYQFTAPSPADEALVAALADSYAVRRHRIYGMIYSPLKRMRPFADAFKVGGGPKKGDKDG